jgi:cell division protein ZipA
MGIRDWLAIIVIICLVLVILDGFRRAWLDRKNRIVMKLDKSIPPSDGEDDDVLLTSELPNGGARTKVRGEVPVLMESVDLNDEDIEDYPGDSDYGDVDSSADTEEWGNVHSSLDDYDEDDEDDEKEDYDADSEEAEAGTRESEEYEHYPDEYAREGDDSEDDWNDDWEHDADDSDDDLDQDTRLSSDPWVANEVDDVEDLEPEEADEAEDTAQETPVEPTKRSAGAALRKAFLNNRGDREERIEPTFGQDESDSDSRDIPDMPLENHDLFDVGSEEETAAEEPEDEDHPVEVIVINVMARAGAELEGVRLLPVLLKQGMRLGDMSIFHRHADMDGKGPVMFSMANMIKPGTFSMSDMQTFSTPGVSFFMQMPNKLGNMACFDQMLKTADAIRNEFDAQLKDENRSVFTRQTIEHCRQRVRDFELEMLARK